MDTIYEALDHLLRGNVNKKSLLENFDYLLLVIDETLDRGIVLETDSHLVASRVAMSERSAQFTPLHEQTLSQILDTAKTELVKQLKQ